MISRKKIFITVCWKQTWKSNFRRRHGVRDGDVEFNVELVLLKVDDVPALAEPAGPLFVRLQPKPIVNKFIQICTLRKTEYMKCSQKTSAKQVVKLIEQTIHQNFIT